MNIQSRSDVVPRMLLVGSDPTWTEISAQAACRMGVRLDIQPDMHAALGVLLLPDHVYSHVLATAPISARQTDALAGMLDEVTRQPTKLLLLGRQSSTGQNPVHCVTDQTVDGLAAALGCERPAVPAGLPPLSPAELAAALHTGGVRVRVQPIMNARTLEPIGMESLARIHHKVRGILHPGEFIPVAVAAARERVLTGIVAARTFLDIGTRLQGSGLFVSLNMPLAILLHDAALARGLELCAVAGVSPTQIVIELLETRTAPDLGRLRASLQAWRAAGFRTAIDDAGRSLPHWRDLLSLPFDILKLDGALVTDPADFGLMACIVSEAKARGLMVVAEGIEDEATLGRVRALGVDALQGFMFSRPLPAMAMPIWLNQWRNQRKQLAA